MKSKSQIIADFKEDLQSLLQKYNAILYIEDPWKWSTESENELRILVEIPSKYDDNGSTIQNGFNIDLGDYIKPSN